MESQLVLQSFAAVSQIHCSITEDTTAMLGQTMCCVKKFTLACLAVFGVVVCADDGLAGACPVRTVMASNYSANPHPGPTETVHVRIDNHRKSRLAADLVFVEADFAETLAAKIPPFQFVTFQSRIGAAWRVRNTADQSILWQAHIVDRQEQHIQLKDCMARFKKTNMTEPPMRMSWSASFAETGGAAVHVESQADHLCGGDDWSDCPVSSPVVVTVTSDIGHLSWPHSEVVTFKRAQKCPHCNATGVAGHEHVHTCSTCDATGVLSFTSTMGFKHAHAAHASDHSMQLESTCPTCKGFGNVLPQATEHKCPFCHGKRSVNLEHSIHIEVPLAVLPGSYTRINNEGNQELLHAQGHIDVAFKAAFSAHVRLLTQRDFLGLISLDAVDFETILLQTMGGVSSLGAASCLVNGTLMVGVRCTEDIPAVGNFKANEERQVPSMQLIQPDVLPPEPAALLAEASIYGVHAIEENALQQLRAQLVTVKVPADEASLDEDEGDKNTTSNAVSGEVPGPHQINATAFELLKRSGLLDLQDFDIIQRSEDDRSVLSSMTRVSIMEAVNGFHATVPLPDGRIAHAVSTSPKSPFEVMPVAGAALPDVNYQNSQQFQEAPFCMEQPYTGNLSSNLPSLDVASVLVRSVAKQLSEFVQCVSMPNEINCAQDVRKTDNGLIRGLQPLQVYSYSSFAEFWRNPALFTVYAAAGCARPHTETLGSNPLFTAQDALAEMSSIKRCLGSCQEQAGGDDAAATVLQWKSGWCETVCPTALAVYEGSSCVENMPQRASKNLGHLAQVTNMTHGISFPRGFIPFCALPPAEVHLRAQTLQQSLASHLQSVLQSAAARYWNLVRLADHFRAKLALRESNGQTRAQKLTLTSDARFLHWLQMDMNATKVAVTAIEAAGLQTTALHLLLLRSTASLFSQSERELLYAPLQLQVAVMYPSSLDDSAQAAIREAFGDPTDTSNGGNMTQRGTRSKKKGRRRIRRAKMTPSARR